MRKTDETKEETVFFLWKTKELSVHNSEVALFNLRPVGDLKGMHIKRPTSVARMAIH